LRFISALVLALAVLAFAACNYFVVGERNLRYVHLSHQRLVAKERRFEKHPGVDDVILWRLDDGRTLQVEAPIDEMAAVGDDIEKSFGVSALSVNRGREVRIPDSDDLRGMRRVAGAIALVALVLAVAAMRRRRETSPKPVES
jgi:hypothetical protein